MVGMYGYNNAVGILSNTVSIKSALNKNALRSPPPRTTGTSGTTGNSGTSGTTGTSGNSGTTGNSGTMVNKGNSRTIAISQTTEPPPLFITHFNKEKKK